MHFENLSKITTTHTAKVLDNKEPKIGDDLLSITDYDVSLTTPGDSISFTFDVVNEGNYNAKITDIVINTPECTGSDETSNYNVCKNIKYELTRSTGASIEEDEIVYAKDKLSLKVTLTYKDTVTADELATSDVSISNLGIKIDFEQSSDALVKDNGEVANYRVYHQGDKITLNNEHYWVIEDSGAGQDYVVALKDTPLTVAEVNTYGIDDNGVNHINMDGTLSMDGTVAFDFNEFCNNETNIEGCNNYNNAQVKYVVDAWATDKFQNNELKMVEGYKARLIYFSETNNLGCKQNNCISTPYEWLKSPDKYWTYHEHENSKAYAYYIYGVNRYPFSWKFRANSVRPVINVYKSALENNNG